MNLSDYFNHHFEIVLADTDALLEEVSRLRYQVYCVENLIFDRNGHKDRREQDYYDTRSVHSLICHKQTGLFVASVRLILPNPQDVQEKFPMEVFCGEHFYDDKIPLEVSQRHSLAEVSRFLVSKQRERQVIEAVALIDQTSEGILPYKRKDGLLCYLLLFGLISATIRITKELKLLFWYVGIDPALFRLLKRFSIDFTQIGPPFEYHGRRLPCIGSTKTILSLMRKYRPELYRFVTKTPESPGRHSSINHSQNSILSIKPHSI